MKPGRYSQGESRPEGVESDRREIWAQPGWVKVTTGSSSYAHVTFTLFNSQLVSALSNGLMLHFNFKSASEDQAGRVPHLPYHPSQSR